MEVKVIGRRGGGDALVHTVIQGSKLMEIFQHVLPKVALSVNTYFTHTGKKRGWRRHTYFLTAWV